MGGLVSSAAALGNYCVQLPQNLGVIRKSSPDSFFGHTYTVMSSQYKVFSDLTNLTDGVHHIVQFCIGAAMAATQGTVFRGAVSLLEVDCYIDGVRAYSDYNYFVKADFLDDWRGGYCAGIASMTSFALSSTSFLVGSGYRLFGATPVGAVASLANMHFCFYACTGGYVMGAIDTSMKIYSEGATTKRIAYLAYCVASVAQRAFILIGGAVVVTPVGATLSGVFMMVSAGCGAWSVYCDQVK